MPLFHQLLTNLPLSAPLRRHPVEVSHLRQRADVSSGVAVTIKTPRHGVRLRVINHVHLIDLPVATDTADSPVHVDRVIKVNVFRGFVDLDPLDRLPGLPRLANQGELGTVLLNLRVTVHADLSRGDIGVGGGLNERVAIAAVHAELSSMDFVGEGNRLMRLVADPGVLRSEVVPNTGTDTAAEQSQTEDDLDREPVSPSWKDVRHVRNRIWA